MKICGQILTVHQDLRQGKFHPSIKNPNDMSDFAAKFRRPSYFCKTFLNDIKVYTVTLKHEICASHPKESKENSFFSLFRNK